MSVRTLDTRIVRQCAFCGTEFLAKQRNRQTCSSKCKSRLYRWRVSLTKTFNEASAHVDGIGTYLKYPDARRGAINALMSLRKQIAVILDENKVKVVQ